jgi:putative membrane protein
VILIANVLVALIAAEHIGFMVLEMFFWTKQLGMDIFGKDLPTATASADVAANQGLYNGFLAAGLIWGLVQAVPGFGFQIKVFFLLCVVVAGVFGAASTNRPSILLVQAAPAVLALILLWLARDRGR